MNGPSERRCAVVYNPIKTSDELRQAIARHATATGWDDAIWLATPADNPGPAITDQVVSARVDRVIAVGGDGTVRVVADRLAQDAHQWQPFIAPRALRALYAADNWERSE